MMVCTIRTPIRCVLCTSQARNIQTVRKCGFPHRTLECMHRYANGGSIPFIGMRTNAACNQSASSITRAHKFRPPHRPVYGLNAIIRLKRVPASHGVRMCWVSISVECERTLHKYVHNLRSKTRSAKACKLNIA